MVIWLALNYARENYYNLTRLSAAWTPQPSLHGCIHGVSWQVRNDFSQATEHYM